MRFVWRALMSVVALCLGELLLMLACLPMGLVGILPSDAQGGIEVPTSFLIGGGVVIWLGAFVWMNANDWDPQ